MCLNISQLIFFLAGIGVGRTLAWCTPAACPAVSSGGWLQQSQPWTSGEAREGIPRVGSSVASLLSPHPIPFLSPYVLSGHSSPSKRHLPPCCLSSCLSARNSSPSFALTGSQKESKLCGWVARKRIVSHVNFTQSLCTLYPCVSLSQFLLKEKKKINDM